MRKIITLFVVGLVALNLGAEPQPVPAPIAIKIEGPPVGVVGYRIKAKLTLNVLDPQVSCFPANNDWYAVQDLNGQKFIDFVPGKRSIPKGQTTQLFTFVVAGNRDAKTFLETYEVLVKSDEEIPEPVPETKSQLYKDYLAAYKVSPNAAALRQCITLYTEFQNEVIADKYSSAKQAGDALAAKFKPVTSLQGVRDVTVDYLQEHVGSTWNKPKLVDAMKVIVTTLKSVPE